MNQYILEPAARQFAHAAAQPPFIEDLDPDEARKVLEAMQAGPVAKPDVESTWIDAEANPTASEAASGVSGLVQSTSTLPDRSPQSATACQVACHGVHSTITSAAEPGSIEDALSSLTEAGARIYLANASHQPLVLLHTVTAPAALRMMLPHLPAELHQTALAYTWQNAAATAAAYGDERPPERDDWPAYEPSAIVERSLAAEEPHAQVRRGLHPRAHSQPEPGLPGRRCGLGVAPS